MTKTLLTIVLLIGANLARADEGAGAKRLSVAVLDFENKTGEDRKSVV